MIEPRLLEQLDRMDRDALRELLRAISSRLEDREGPGDATRVRLADLAGVGEDYWRSIDVDRYLEGERNSWDS